jgi:hypothetical protein
MRFFATFLPLALAFAQSAAAALVQQNVKSADGTVIYAEGQGNKSGAHRMRFIFIIFRRYAQICFSLSVILAPGLACTTIVFDRLFSNNALNAAVYMVRFPILFSSILTDRTLRFASILADMAAAASLSTPLTIKARGMRRTSTRWSRRMA